MFSLLAPGLLLCSCVRCHVTGGVGGASTLSQSQQADKLEAGNIVKTYLEQSQSVQNTGMIGAMATAGINK